jgi:hypothetical protein
LSLDQSISIFPEWSEAEQLYDYILKKEPYRIDDMDVYSNILHVMEKRSKLSKLAHDLLAVDKDRPEVCCIVGKSVSLCPDGWVPTPILSRKSLQLTG